MKTFQLATLLIVTILFSSCASTDGVKTNAWGYNNNPNRQQPQEEETETRPTQRINNDMWQNPLVVSGYDDMFYPSMMFNAPPRFVPVMVPWWESSRYWHYNSSRHFMFQCDPMLVYWDWYSPFYTTNPFWGGVFVPTRYAWGGFTTYNPPVTRTIVEPTRTQQVRDFGPNRGTTSNPNTTRQVAPTNDGWNNRSQNYRQTNSTSTPVRTNERTNSDGWNNRTTTPTTPTRTQTTSPTRTQTTSPTRTQTTSPTRTFTRESSKPAPSRSTTSSPSRATSSPSRTTTTPKSSPSTTTKRTGR